MVESRINITEKTRFGTLFFFSWAIVFEGKHISPWICVRGNTHHEDTCECDTGRHCHKYANLKLSEMQIPQHYSLTSDCLILSHSQQRVPKAALVLGEVKIYT